MASQHRVILVYGRVQGVFFRQSAQEQARQLGVGGYTRNNPDGSVTIEAEGPVEALDALQAWCHHGPPAAQVHTVQATAGPLVGYSGFEVRR
ncbi:acylphosphatase [Hymenobacter puniceus]|uniref:acylphosphatase n=1 Tax=Hymenobacter sp. BT190 TaxID=2763505 RepID=UPI00165110E4|nr:acylphosphatase [Hymenobacter sp. BT190]MBC6697695.1 acylphosphatase [Hymenobacter sp. BT190]